MGGFGGKGLRDVLREGGGSRVIMGGLGDRNGGSQWGTGRQGMPASWGSISWKEEGVFGGGRGRESNLGKHPHVVLVGAAGRGR